MVILAAVSINAAYQSGIIDYAVNGTQTYVEGAEEEKTRLASAEGLMDSVIARLEGLQGGSQEDDVDGDWVIAWVLMDSDENNIYWSNPYFKDNNLKETDFPDMDDDYSVSSIEEIRNANIKALLFPDTDSSESYGYVLKISGTGEVPDCWDFNRWRSTKNLLYESWGNLGSGKRPFLVRSGMKV